MTFKTMRELFAEIDAKLEASRPKPVTVRIEIRNRTIIREFPTLQEAQSFWDKAHRYGMNIDSRP